MFDSNKDIDLLVPYNYEEPFYIKYRTAIKLITPVVIVVVLFVGVFAFLQVGNNATRKQISEAQTTLANLQAEESKTAVLDPAYQAYLDMKKLNENVAAINTALDSYPTLSKTAMVAIESACARSTIKSILYSEVDGTVTINLEAEDVTLGENIVRTLKSLHYFSDVSHHGYNANEVITNTNEKTETKLKYNMIITCELVGGN